MPDARRRRERLHHPEGGHTSTELDILSEPAARALALARLEAEAEDARREAEAAAAEALWWATLIACAEAEDKRRDAGERAIAHKIARIAKANLKQQTKIDLTQQTEPRLCPPPPKLRTIARAVAEHYKITVVDLASKRRTASVVRPRQVFCYLARKLTFQSLPQIGEALGGKDHTTVLHAFNKIACLLHEDAKLAADIDAIRKALEGAPDRGRGQA